VWCRAMHQKSTPVAGWCVAGTGLTLRLSSFEVERV
jgi:hypothetical protein